MKKKGENGREGKKMLGETEQERVIAEEVRNLDVAHEARGISVKPQGIENAKQKGLGCWVRE